MQLIWLFFVFPTSKPYSPIILIATFHVEHDDDGTEIALCFTPADTFWSVFYFIACITIFFVLPLFVLLLLYAAIACKLLRRNLDFHRPTTTAAHVPSTTCISSVILHQQSFKKLSIQMTTPKDVGAGAQHLSGCMRKHRKQVIFMLIAVVSSFFICLLPFRAFTLWVIVTPAEEINTLGIDSYYVILYLSRVMLYLNSALNPILYNLMSSKFRNGFYRLIVSCCGGESRRQSRERAIGRANRRTAVGGTSAIITTATKSRQQREDICAGAHNQRRLNFKRQSTFMLSSSISTSSGTERTSSTSGGSISSGFRPVIVKRSVIGNAIIGITKSTITTACPLESEEISSREREQAEENPA